MTYAARVLALRVTAPPPLPRVHGRPDAPDLLPAQAHALGEMARTAVMGDGPWGPRGFMGFIGCGHGKTLICQLAPEVFNARRPMLLVPNANYDATLRAIMDWSRFFRTRPIRVITYESLSSQSGSQEVERYAPDLLICDEAHYLASRDSGRWKRLARYVAHNRHCRCVFVSGTMIGKSLLSWAHLAHAALRDISPVPADRSELASWAAVLDHDGEPNKADWTALEAWGPLYDQDDARDKFHEILASSPGVTFSHGVSADTSLYLISRPGLVTPPPAVIEAQKSIESRWELPDGTEVVDTLEFLRHERTLRHGFYSVWAPRPINPKKAEAYDFFFAARKAWGRILRMALEDGLGDTPGEVEARVEVGDMSRGKEEWRAWKFARSQEPDRVMHWLPGARDWLSELVRVEVAEVPGEGDVVIWYGSRALESVLRDLGYPTHGIGSQAPLKGDAAVSYHVHGKGWNGQRYSRQFMLETPQSAKTWQQTLSRMHRHGQTRDVYCAVYLPTIGSQIELRKVKAHSRHVELLTRERQRVLFGTWL